VPCPVCLEDHRDERAPCGDGAPAPGDDLAASSLDGVDPRVGTSLCEGRYQLLSVVGHGGVARVYEAIDATTGRKVALKILHAAYAGQSVVVERFWREYRFSSLVKHPNLVDVVAFRRAEDGVLALVMEYLEGESLFAVLARERTLHPSRVLPIVSEVALGLAAAHDKKLVHRDLKPGNVFLCAPRGEPRRDVVKLLDFGVARDNSAHAAQLTEAGAVIGTPAYMSPEQVRGERDLDHRTDVWSLGVLAYECLTGRLPFAGKTYQATLGGILGEAPAAPSTLDLPHPLPRAIDTWLGRALAKSPDARFASVGELADELGRAFGLDDDHRAWAVCTREELADRLARATPFAADGI
jgi:serine/threonine-protein kinase